MSDSHRANSGSLNATLLSVNMEIDDDDEDVIEAVFSISNEAAIPRGGLTPIIETTSGERFAAIEGVESLGPGKEKNFDFQFILEEGEWTFKLEGMEIGPFAADFEFKAAEGRRLKSTMGSSFFTGAFDTGLGDFGQVRERELIDSSKVVMTQYSAEDVTGGGTKISASEASDLLSQASEVSTGMTTSSGDSAREAPIIQSTQMRDAPMTSLSRTEDPLLAHTDSSPAKREAPSLVSEERVATESIPLPTATAPEPEPEPQVEPEPVVDPLFAPLPNATVAPPTPPAAPPTPPAAPPPTPPAAPPPTPPLAPPTGPPAGPPSGPPGPPSGPPGPPSGPPGPPSGPPGPPSGPPSGPPAGPPSGPPASPPASQD